VGHLAANSDGDGYHSGHLCRIASHVGNGSLADMAASISDVRLPSDNGHQRDVPARPFRARSSHSPLGLSSLLAAPSLPHPPIALLHCAGISDRITKLCPGDVIA
jgi:hypothetical protein